MGILDPCASGISLTSLSSSIVGRGVVSSGGVPTVSSPPSVLGGQGL